MEKVKTLTRGQQAQIVNEPAQKEAKGLEENKIVGSANVIAYAMKESWFAGFEEGRKYPLTESN